MPAGTASECDRPVAEKGLYFSTVSPPAVRARSGKYPTRTAFPVRSQRKRPSGFQARGEGLAWPSKVCGSS